MNRREFLKTASWGAGSLVVSGCVWGAGTAARQTHKNQPNIILFISDDHGWADTGCYGNNVVRTPNIDHLAKQGLRFTIAFAGSPTCTPSRSVLYTGLMPIRNGAHPNHSEIKPGVKTLPTYMKRLGYRVVLAGKVHVGPKDAFDFEYVPARLTGDKAMPRPRVYGEDLDVEAVDKVIAEHTANHAEEPLFLVVSSWSPHVAWRWKRYDPEKVIVPPYLVDTPLTREAIARYYTDISVLDRQIGSCLESVEKHGLADNTIFAYTSDQGAQFPHGKWNLYDVGIRTPLIVRWPGRTPEGSVSDAMVSLADLLPTFIEAGGGTAPADIDGRSFLPVILGRKTEHREFIFATHTGDGKMNDFPIRCVRTRTHKYILNLKSYKPYTSWITDGDDISGRDYWNEWLEKAKTGPQAERLVYNEQHRSTEELYDLRTDPYELNNVAQVQANRELLASLRKTLKKWLRQQGDREGLSAMEKLTKV